VQEVVLTSAEQDAQLRRERRDELIKQSSLTPYMHCLEGTVHAFAATTPFTTRPTSRTRIDQPGKPGTEKPGKPGKPTGALCLRRPPPRPIRAGGNKTDASPLVSTGITGEKVAVEVRLTELYLYVLGPAPGVDVMAKRPPGLLNAGTLSARMAVLRSCAP
jgi:hypothetical protein